VSVFIRPLHTFSAWVETFHPDDKQPFLSTLHSYLASKERSFATEFRKWSAENSLEWVLARGKLVNSDEQGRPIRVIGTLTNISATKNLQAQLSQAQKLEAIGQLAAGVSHEINTPIQYIGDNLSALHDNFADIMSFHNALFEVLDEVATQKIKVLADQYDMTFILEDSPLAIHQAREGVERVTEIVKAIKTFSHVGCGENKQFINLHEALNNALIITRNSYKYIAEVETDYSTEISTIECYASELTQVFINMMINAAHSIEETQSGIGMIKVITRKLGASVEILFQDNGAGIPAEIQDKVFNLFFTTKEVGKGTGQGLSLSHNIVVNRHGGQLFFESSQDHGTSFHIQIPL
jgi:signal transduction histidine kinase